MHIWCTQTHHTCTNERQLRETAEEFEYTGDGRSSRYLDLDRRRPRCAAHVAHRT